MYVYLVAPRASIHEYSDHTFVAFSQEENANKYVDVCANEGKHCGIWGVLVDGSSELATLEALKTNYWAVRISTSIGDFYEPTYTRTLTTSVHRLNVDELPFYQEAHRWNILPNETTPATPSRYGDNNDEEIAKHYEWTLLVTAATEEEARAKCDPILISFAKKHLREDLKTLFAHLCQEYEKMGEST